MRRIGMSMSSLVIAATLLVHFLAASVGKLSVHFCVCGRGRGGWMRKGGGEIG